MKHHSKNSVLHAPFIRIRKVRPKTVGRVALLLAGEVRTLDYCLKRQLEKIDSADSIHVFLATWDRTTPSHRQGISNHNSSIIRADDQQKPGKVTLEDLKTRFPKIDSVSVFCQAETQENHTSLLKEGYGFEEKENHVNGKVYLTLNQLFLLENAIRMMQAQEATQAAQFDYVIRSRPDIIFKRKVLWPSDNELILDCLKPTRRRYGALFDGFFISPRMHVEKLSVLYNDYVGLAARSELLQTFSYDYCVKYGLLELLYHKTVNDGFLVCENFIRFTYAQVPALDMVDGRLSVKLVR